MLFKILGWYSLLVMIINIVQGCLMDNDKEHRVASFIVLVPIAYYLFMSVFGMGK